MKKSQLYEAINVLLKQQNYLIQRKKTTTTFSSPIVMRNLNQNITSFSEINLPFLVKGTLITSGVYNDSRYGKINVGTEVLKESVPKWQGIYIYKHHGVFQSIIDNKEEVPIDSVVGVITKTSWNEKKNCIDYEAEVDDSDIAFKISRGLIKHVSVSFTQDKKPIKGGYDFINIQPLELSLVFRPRDKNASILPK